MDVYRYYFSTMSREEQAVYIPLAEGLSQFAPAIRVPKLETERLYDVLYRLRMDDPRLCFVKNASIRGYRDATHVEILPDYAFPPAKMKTTLAAIDARVTKITAPIRALKTPREKVLAVHDWLIDSVKYDKLYKNYAHEVIGTLCHGTAVCEGIAKTAKILLDALGIECIDVISEAETKADGTQGFRHAWNVVRFDRRWVHMDATFDNSLTCCGKRRYDEWGLSDREIYVNHRPSLYPLPPCPQGYTYYQDEKLAVSTAEELTRFLKKTGRKSTAVFLFQWTGEDFPAETIARTCAGFAAERGKSARIHFYEPRKVTLFTLTNPNEDTGGQDEQHPD